MVSYGKKRETLKKEMSLLGGNVYVYLLTFPTHKHYIGVSKNPLSRFADHRDPKQANCTGVARAVRKYGRDSFSMTLLASYDTYEEAFAKERSMIARFNSIEEGYNLSAGGGEGTLIREYLVGSRFGMLTVVKDSGKRNSSQTVVWECVCDCGGTAERTTSVLRNVGKYRTSEASCGCTYLTKTAPSAVTHNMSSTATYSTWLATKKRCGNPNASDYAAYGGRGIQMCDAWSSSFEKFLEDMGERTEGSVLCRRDKEKNFSPTNCFWGNRKEASAGNRRLHVLHAFGESKSLAEWARDPRITEQGLTYTTLRARKNILGWTDRLTLGDTTPCIQRRSRASPKHPEKSTSTT